MDTEQALDTRIDCAKAVCPYLFPRLQALAVKSEEDQRLTIVFQDFNGNVASIGPKRSPAIEAAIGAAVADDEAEAADDAEAAD